MKKVYTGFYKKSQSDLKAIWENGLITFDANVLLNLYRYSKSTRQDIMKLVEKLSSKVFLTYQAGLEFHKNRFDVISEQEKAYGEFLISLTKIENELSSKSKHPFISDENHIKLNATLNEVKTDIEESKKYYGDLINNDIIYEEIDKLFDSKIENPFSEDQLKIIFEEGKNRYEKKIPPGYEDEKDKLGNKIFGDLILWKEIIEKAKKIKKPIIFITDEKKKDWWWKLNNGITIGPRQELIQEMKSEAGVDFQLYSTDKFVEFGSEYLKEVGNKQVIEEIKDLNYNFINHDYNLEHILRLNSKYLHLARVSQDIKNKMKMDSGSTRFITNDDICFLLKISFNLREIGFTEIFNKINNIERTQYDEETIKNSEIIIYMKYEGPDSPNDVIVSIHNQFDKNQINYIALA